MFASGEVAVGSGAMVQSTWSPAASLKKLETWAHKHGCRVKLCAPLTAAAIDAIGPR